METKEFKDKDFFELLHECSYIDKGEIGVIVRTLTGDVWKIDKNLYNEIFNNPTFHKWYQDSLFMKRNKNFVDEKQIRYLNRREKATGVKFDTGVIKIEDLVVGTIIQYHDGYEKLSEAKLEEKNLLLTMLREILLKIKALEENNISLIDLTSGSNILYKGNSIEFCDLSGQYVLYGRNSDKFLMYQEYYTILCMISIFLYKDSPMIRTYLKKLNRKKFNCYENVSASLLELESIFKR